MLQKVIFHFLLASAFLLVDKLSLPTSQYWYLRRMSTSKLISASMTQTNSSFKKSTSIMKGHRLIWWAGRWRSLHNELLLTRHISKTTSWCHTLLFLKNTKAVTCHFFLALNLYLALNLLMNDHLVSNNTQMRNQVSDIK